MIRPCCDNPDCPFCFGSGIAEVSEVEQQAIDVLCMIATHDLNQDDERAAIRKLANMVLHRPADGYTTAEDWKRHHHQPKPAKEV